MVLIQWYEELAGMCVFKKHVYSKHFVDAHDASCLELRASLCSQALIIPRMTFDLPERKAEREPGRFCDMT